MVRICEEVGIKLKKNYQNSYLIKILTQNMSECGWHSTNVATPSSFVVLEALIIGQV